MKCSNCGKEMEDIDRFCRECGSGVEPSQTSDQAYRQSEGDAPQANTLYPPPCYQAPEVAWQAYSPMSGYTVHSKTSGLAVASLILSVASLLFIPFIGAILGLVFGFIAKKDIKDSAGAYEGSKIASAGIVLGCISLLLHIAAAVTVLFLIF